MVCLDTDILVAFLRGVPAAKVKMESLLMAGEQLSTTPINATELFKGVFRMSNGKRELEQVTGVMSSLTLLDYGSECARKAGELMQVLMKKGEYIGDMDCIIAAIVMVHSQVLVTRNLEHFERVPGLRIEKW
jgi:predicted nucleic acid-binding protein